MSLRNTQDILRFTTQMIDDGRERAAIELARLALEEDPEQRALWVFLLAKAFDRNDADAFREALPLFLRYYANDPDRTELEALGRWLELGGPAGDTTRTAKWQPHALIGQDGIDQKAFHEILTHTAVRPPMR
jgi:hypothetical protein